MRKSWKIILAFVTSFFVPISSFTSVNWVAAQSLISLGQQAKYSGSFTNTNYSVGGNVDIELTFEQNNKASGYINFTNKPGESPICGAGNFTDAIQGRNLQLRFISNDPDPGCGFEKGWIFIVNATLSPDSRRLENGTYQVNNTQAGTFQATSLAQAEESTRLTDTAVCAHIRYSKASYKWDRNEAIFLRPTREDSQCY